MVVPVHIGVIVMIVGMTHGSVKPSYPGCIRIVVIIPVEIIVVDDPTVGIGIGLGIHVGCFILRITVGFFVAVVNRFITFKLFIGHNYFLYMNYRIAG